MNSIKGQIDTHIVYILCWCCYLVAQSCPTLCDLMDYIAQQGPLSMGFPGRNTAVWLTFPPPGGLPDPGTELFTSSIMLFEGLLTARRENMGFPQSVGIFVPKGEMCTNNLLYTLVDRSLRGDYNKAHLDSYKAC